MGGIKAQIAVTEAFQDLLRKPSPVALSPSARGANRIPNLSLKLGLNRHGTLPAVQMHRIERPFVFLVWNHAGLAD